MANHELSMESIDSGSNYSFGDKMIKSNAPSSVFDLSHLSTLDIYNAGIMVPICSPIECIMGDDMEISVASLVRVLPQEVPLYSRQRLYVYAFYSRCSDLWENWNTFARKGMLGKTIKEIPTLNNNNWINGQYNDESGEIQVNSLGDYMGLPIGLDPTDETWSGKISALPFMMWARIWRDYFINKNIYAGNPAIFPDNDDHFRLDDNGRLISAKELDYTSEGVEHKFNLKFGASGTAEDDTWIKNQLVKFGVAASVDDTKADIKLGLFYHDWPDDRFTDALPWPQRGTEPTLEFTASEQNLLKQLVNDTYVDDALLGEGFSGGLEALSLNPLQGTNNLNPSNPSFSGTTGLIAGLKNNTSSSYGTDKINWSEIDDPSRTDLTLTYAHGTTSEKIKLSGNKLVGLINERANRRLTSTVTLNAIRDLAIDQTELEKMAMTDGTYMGFSMTFFNEKPKNATDYKPVYIGGTYTDLKFTEVLQTGAATQGSPLGNYAGHGIGANNINQGYIGKIHCDDFGYIMLCACIMPDVYYSQKVDKMWTRKFQSDLYLPDRAKMGMIPILNHEIDAMQAPEGKTVFDLWAYCMPYDELRYRANEIHGQLADPSKEYFFNYTQSRYFGSAPNWGKEFSEASDVRMNYLATGNQESAYTAQFKINIRAVRKLPYKAVPAQII